MRWEQINFNRSEWVIPLTKNGDPQTVPLTEQALELLRERSRKTNSPLGISQQFKRFRPSHGSKKGMETHSNEGNNCARGSRNKATLAVQALLDGEAEGISRKAIELAKDGDLQAIKLVLERVLPPRKDALIELELPKVEKAEDVVSAISAIMEAVARGELTPSEGRILTGMVDNLRKGIETTELEAKLSHLESILESR